MVIYRHRLEHRILKFSTTNVHMSLLTTVNRSRTLDLFIFRMPAPEILGGYAFSST